jgi:hypothetical protein
MKFAALLAYVRRDQILFFAGDILDQRPSWPLLRRVNSAIPQNYVQQLSVVQWAMTLPDRSSQQNPRILNFEESCEFKAVNFKA